MFSQVAPMGKILYILLALACVYQSVESSQVKEKVFCDEAFKCPQGSKNPFRLGHQYKYEVGLASSLTLASENFFNAPLEDDEITGNSSSNDYIWVWATSECELLVKLQPQKTEDFEPVLKVAIVDGKIQRTCYDSQQDVSSQAVNVLKALASLFQDEGAEADMETTNIGTCLSKRVQCPREDLSVKYQSTVHCSRNLEPWDLLQNYQVKSWYFLNKLWGLSEAHCQMETEDVDLILQELDKTLEDRAGLSVCLNVKNEESLLTKAVCLENQDLATVASEDGRSRSTVTLSLVDEISEGTQTPPNSFFQTSLIHVASPDAYITPEAVLPTDYDLPFTLADIVQSISTSPSLGPFESAKLIEQFRSLVLGGANSDDLMVGLLSIIFELEGVEQNAILFLNLVSSEAKSKEVFDFLQEVFSDNWLMSQIFGEGEEAQTVLSKVVGVISEQTCTTTDLLEFSKFIATFLNGEKREKFPNDLRVDSYITLGHHLNEYCTHMEIKTGVRYCAKNEIIPSSFMMKDPSTSLEELFNLEALGVFYHHLNETGLENVYEARRSKAGALWALINSARSRPCATENKNFLRRILQDPGSSSNERITAFLGLAKCFDETDAEVINEALRNTIAGDEELVNFIEGYTSDRLSPGKTQFEDIEIPEVSAVTEGKPSKMARASSTFLTQRIPGTGEISLETNILYFDKPAWLPQLITLNLQLTRLDLFESTMENDAVVGSLEVEVYVDDYRNPEIDRSTSDFDVLLVIRYQGRTQRIKGIPVTKEKLLEYVMEIQRFIREGFSNSWSTDVSTWLLNFLTRDVDYNLLEFSNKVNEAHLHYTISGVMWRHTKKKESSYKLQLQKNDCSDVLRQTGDEEASCTINLNLELDQTSKIYYVLQELKYTSKDNIEQGFVNQRSLQTLLPFSLKLSKNIQEEDSKPEVRIMLTAPSLSAPLFNNKISYSGVTLRNGHVLESELVAGENNMLGLMGLYYVPLTAPEIWSSDKLNITLRTTSKGASLEISDSMLQGKIAGEFGPFYSFQGNFSTTLEGNMEKQYSFKVGAKNIDDDKRFHVEVLMDSEQYALETHYIRTFTDCESNDDSSCGSQEGNGILCYWPLCILCGSEYSIGATVVTPKYRVKVFDWSLKQTYPDKKMEIILETEGLPLVPLVMKRVKVTLEGGDRSTFFENSTLAPTLRTKWNEYMEDYNVEQQIVPSTESYIIRSNAYSLQAEITGYYIGQTEVSLAIIIDSFISLDDSSDLFLFMGALNLAQLSPTNGARREIEFTLAHHMIDKYGYILSQEKYSLKNSIFPSLDGNVVWRKEIFQDDLKTVSALEVQPVNMLSGPIRMEMTDYIEWPILYCNLWSGCNKLNQTYRVFLPSEFKINHIKTKLIFRRIDEEIQVAGIDATLGSDHGFQLNYERFPEQGNTLKIITSVTYDRESYEMHHKIEPEPVATTVSDGEDLPKYKYRGAYVLSNNSLSAKGYFLGKRGGEILPFSKFNIQVASVQGQSQNFRIFGVENVIQEKIHRMKIGVNKEESTVFQLNSEMNPDDQLPLKASISLKETAEIMIFDSSKLNNCMNLTVKAKLLENGRVIESNIAFPLTLEVPLYLDADLSISEEVDAEYPVFKVSTRSSLESSRKLNVSSENSLQLRDSIWECNFDVSYARESQFMFQKDLKFQKAENASLSMEYVRPDRTKYGLWMGWNKLSQNWRQDWNKYYFRSERPNITPLNFHLETEDRLVEIEHTETEDSFEGVITKRTLFAFCHQDNFLHLFPKLDADYKLETKSTKRFSESKGFGWAKKNGNITCESHGIPIMSKLCNQIDLRYQLNYNQEGGELFGAINSNITFTVVNHLQSGVADELKGDLKFTYELLRKVNDNDTDEPEDNLFLEVFGTRFGDDLYKTTLNLEYDLQRKFPEQGTTNDSGLSGKYKLARVFESLDNFEIIDEHRWKILGSANSHVWANRINHTIDHTSSPDEHFSLFSHVSFNDEESSSGENIVYLEVQSELNSKGFDPIEILNQRSSSVTQMYEGSYDADLSIRSELTSVNNFRVQVSEEYNIVGDVDDGSTKIEASTNFSGILNDREISGTNSLTTIIGKSYFGNGRIFKGRYNANGEYELLTLKVFEVVPRYEEFSRDKLSHLDVISSWSNQDDENTEFRLVRDMILDEDLGRFFARYTFTTLSNSSNLDLTDTKTLILHKNLPEKILQPHWEESLPAIFISEDLAELNLTQTSLHDISEQILSEYFGSGVMVPWDYSGDLDYNAEYINTLSGSDFSTQSRTKLRVLGVQDKLYQCEASLQELDWLNRETNPIYFFNITSDVSNYCNLAILPLKPFFIADA